MNQGKQLLCQGDVKIKVSDSQGLKETPHGTLSCDVPVSYLDSGLGEVDPTGEILSDKGIRVVCPLKHSLQSLELAAVEGGPVPALLPLLLLLRVHLFICREKKKKKMLNLCTVKCE